MFFDYQNKTLYRCGVGMNASHTLHLHHTVIPPWIYRIPSELRSQAELGLPSTVVGDYTGIVSAVCFYFHNEVPLWSATKQCDCQNFESHKV